MSKTLLTLSAIGIVSIPSLLFMLCKYGNPQWHRDIYIFQCYRLSRISADTPERIEYTGIWRDWTRDGNLTFEGKYVKGVPQGLHTDWHDNGTKALEIGYGKNGKKQYIISWAESGVLKFVIPYHNDVKHGTTIFYDPTGAIEKAHQYENGEFVVEHLNPFGKETPNKSGLAQPVAPATSP